MGYLLLLFGLAVLVAGSAMTAMRKRPRYDRGRGWRAVPCSRFVGAALLVQGGAVGAAGVEVEIGTRTGLSLAVSSAALLGQILMLVGITRSASDR